MKVTIPEGDILTAITGIVNARLSDGVDDGTGTVHSVSVVIWRQGLGEYVASTALSVITHVDNVSVFPFGGETVTVFDISDIDAVVRAVAACAMRRTDDELDNRAEALAIANTTGPDRVELEAQIPATVAGSNLRRMIREVEATFVHDGIHEVGDGIDYVGEFKVECGARFFAGIKVTDDTDDITCPKCIALSWGRDGLPGFENRAEITSANR